MGRPVAVVIWLSLGAGCASPEELRAIEVCDAFCTCLAPLPSQNDQCTDECLAELSFAGVSDACLECAQEASCSQVNGCRETCFDVIVPSLGGTP